VELELEFEFQREPEFEFEFEFEGRSWSELHSGGRIFAAQTLKPERSRARQEAASLEAEIWIGGGPPPPISACMGPLACISRVVAGWLAGRSPARANAAGGPLASQPPVCVRARPGAQAELARSCPRLPALGRSHGNSERASSR